MQTRLKSITLFTLLFTVLFFAVPSLVAALTFTVEQTALPLAALFALGTLWLLRRHLPPVSAFRRHHIPKTTV
jgi:lipopolysaccharide export LptBFGC system permease protein LptF